MNVDVHMRAKSGSCLLFRKGSGSCEIVLASNLVIRGKLKIQEHVPSEMSSPIHTFSQFYFGVFSQYANAILCNSSKSMMMYNISSPSTPEGFYPTNPPSHSDRLASEPSGLSAPCLRTSQLQVRLGELGLAGQASDARSTEDRVSTKAERRPRGRQ